MEKCSYGCPALIVKLQATHHSLFQSLTLICLFALNNEKLVCVFPYTCALISIHLNIVCTFHMAIGKKVDLGVLPLPYALGQSLLCSLQCICKLHCFPKDYGEHTSSSQHWAFLSGTSLLSILLSYVWSSLLIEKCCPPISFHIPYTGKHRALDLTLWKFWCYCNYVLSPPFSPTTVLLLGDHPVVC